MGIVLKLTWISAGALMIVLAGYVVVSSYDSSQQSAEAAKVAEATSVARDVIQVRVDKLAVDGCQSVVMQLMTLHAKQPITNSKAIPAGLREDLVLCLQRGIMYGYAKAEIENVGILKLIKPDAS